jgi:ABC-2 type transport system ATP-binding protein
MTAIEVDGLSKRFGSKVAVDDVSFTVAEGEIFGLLGRNGAGKSTTVDCLAGLRVPDYGRIRVAGRDPRQDRREVRQLLGVQLQESQLPDRLTVTEAMRLYASFYPRPADIDGLLARLDLTDKLNTRYRRLSGGQKQRLSIALALIGRPRIAILDELTTGLDPVARRDTWQLIDDIRNQGVTIVLVTHFMDEAARLCDRVAIMRDGRIAALGAPAALAQPTLEDAFVALTGRRTS